MNPASILNPSPASVFVILAETLPGWKSPASPEGKSVLMEHYTWAKQLKESGLLIMAGPSDIELPHEAHHITGIIMLDAPSREIAEAWAMKDPFHLHGFRRNRVQSLKISISSDEKIAQLRQIK